MKNIKLNIPYSINEDLLFYKYYETIEDLNDSKRDFFWDLELPENIITIPYEDNPNSYIIHYSEIDFYLNKLGLGLKFDKRTRRLNPKIVSNFEKTNISSKLNLFYIDKRKLNLDSKKEIITHLENNSDISYNFEDFGQNFIISNKPYSYQDNIGFLIYLAEAIYETSLGENYYMGFSNNMKPFLKKRNIIFDLYRKDLEKEELKIQRLLDAGCKYLSLEDKLILYGFEENPETFDLITHMNFNF